MTSAKNLAYDLDYEQDYLTTSPKKIGDSRSGNSNVKSSRRISSINAQIKNKIASKSKAAMIGSVLLVTGLFAILSCRYNVISEKNLEIQRLNITLNEVQTELTNAEIALSGMVDIEEIEAYAKQQLGMKEMSKNQIIYVETESDTSIISPSEENLFEKISNFFSRLFN